MISFRRALSVGAALLPLVAAGAEWRKFVAADGSFSLHHPAGWTAAEDGGVVTFSDDAAGEEVLVVRVPHQASIEQAANLVVLALAENVEGLEVLQRAETPGAGMGLRLAFRADGKPVRMVAFVAPAGSHDTWISYARVASAFDAARGKALLEGIASSFASGAGSRPPVAGGAGDATAAAPAGLAAGGAAGAGETPAAWFTPPGKELRGYYGGVVLTKEVSSSLTTTSSGFNASGELGSYTNRTIGGNDGGDFRLALYADGTARAQLLVLDAALTYRRHTPFQYEGRYTLRDGALRAAELKLVNQPSTFWKMEGFLRTMRIQARHDAASDTFSAAKVDLYNSKDGKWEVWTPGTTLARPGKARGFGGASVGNADTGMETYATEEPSPAGPGSPR